MFNKEIEITIGKVLSPHGVSGFLKVFPYSDFPERISILEDVDLLKKTVRTKMTIESASIYGRFWLVKFTGINSREEAARLTDALLIIPRSDRLPLPTGHYYHDQLIGLIVFNEKGICLGSVVDLILTGGHDVLLVKAEDQDQPKDVLIPLVSRFISEINLDDQTIVVNLPDGLLEI